MKLKFQNEMVYDFFAGTGGQVPSYRCPAMTDDRPCVAFFVNLDSKIGPAWKIRKEEIEKTSFRIFLMCTTKD